MLLHIAYKAEKGLDIRQENSIAKIFHAHMVHKVIDTAIQLHGALGFSQDTPLAKWYTQVRAQRLVDGPDEVHKWRIGKNVIKAFREHGTTASAAGGDLLYRRVLEQHQQCHCGLNRQSIPLKNVTDDGLPVLSPRNDGESA